MNDHLNFFAPYEGAVAWHENQLTRALLVVLKYSPLAHQIWLRFVAPRQELSDLSKATFGTQRQRVLESETHVPDGESVVGISVFLAPDAEIVDASVESSDRNQILDGVVTYGTELVVVIENKITFGAPTDQPHLINLHGSAVKFAPTPVSVSWQRLLGAFVGLVERDLVTGAERLLISDFLELVEEYFPQIGPYSSLVQCGNGHFRIERRLDTVIGEAVGTTRGKGPGWRDLSGTRRLMMARLKLSDDDVSVYLQMYPGDALGQSRAFYGDPSVVAAVLALKSEGWNISPNFHWGFMATGYAWMNSSLSVEEYCAYWISTIGDTREVGRGDWESYWARLEADRIVEPDAKALFDTEFTKSKRQKASPRPGLSCEYSWELVEAKRLDAAGKLVERVRERINQMLIALRAPTIPSI
jgi:hypothetical protein